MKMRKYIIWILLPAVFTGCRKFVQVPDPETSLGTSAVFSSDETATAALMGLYSRAMSSQGNFLNGGNTIYPSLSADECTLLQSIPAMAEFNDNALESGNTYIAQLYGSAYNVVYNANILLENLPKSKVSESVRQQLMGEALFVRALVYSRLVVLWGAVPLLTGTDADKNAVAKQSQPNFVYSQVLQDLREADGRLSMAYAWKGTGVPERTRPNRWAARALTARVDLYLGLWAAAASAATAVIDSGGYVLEPSLGDVFLKGSREAIWQLQPVSSTINSAEAYYYLPPDNPQARPSYILTTSLLQSFETGDQRRARWVGTKTVGGVVYNYPAKYKVRAGPPYREYSMALRLAEVYLIRAEARAQLGELTAAIQDLNVVRSRAGLPNYTSALTREAVLAAVRQERRVELFAEWGHRWADLLRWGLADDVLSLVKPHWTTAAQLYPLPLSDMLRNDGLVQNPGYE